MRPTCNKYQRFVTKEFVCVLFYIFFDIVIMIELFFRSKLKKSLHFITLMIIGSSLAASTSIAQVSEPLTSHSDKYQTNEKPSRNIRRLLSYISRRTIVTIRQGFVQVATTVAWDRTFSKENYRFWRKCRTHILQTLPKLVFKKNPLSLCYILCQFEMELEQKSNWCPCRQLQNVEFLSSWISPAVVISISR